MNKYKVKFKFRLLPLEEGITPIIVIGWGLGVFMIHLLFFTFTVEKKGNFYCQREIEGESGCKEQCDHCEEYYRPIEKNQYNG